MNVESRVLSTENRYVTEWDGQVVKRGCPLDVLSGAQNRVEIDTWLRVQGTPESRFFVPVLDGSADGTWLRMPYVQPITTPSQALLWDIADEIHAHGITLFDLTRHNIGYYNGRVALLDYGHTRKMQADYMANGRRFCGVCKYCALTFRDSSQA
jgi:hypothetical protein